VCGQRDEEPRMSFPRRIVIRVDGSRSAGLGHLMRCSALAEALRRSGVLPLFCTFDEDGQAERLLAKRGFETARLHLAARSEVGAEEDLKQVLSCGQREGSNAIIVDSYSIPPTYLESLKRCGCFVICLDDHAERRLNVDMVINGNPGAEELVYQCPDVTRILAGASYALLRNEFRGARESSGIAVLRRRVERVLVCFGGSDFCGQTIPVLRLLQRLPDDFSIVVLVTSLFGHKYALESLVRHSSRAIEVHCEPPDVARLMHGCDVAVTAAGVTSYELACLGVPSLVMKLYDNQRYAHHHLIHRGIAINGGERGVDSGGFFLRQFRRLLSSRRLRAEIQRQAAAAIDGLGATRAADTICWAIGAAGGMHPQPAIRLR